MGITHQPKNWVQVPYSYFFVVFYAALGMAMAVHPVNQQTLEIAGEGAAWLGRILAALFFVMAFILWQTELRGKWLTYSVLPAVIWGAYSMVSILGQDRASWVVAVFIAGSIALLVYSTELKLILQSSEVVNELITKENAALKLENETLKRASAANDKRPA